MPDESSLQAASAVVLCLSGHDPSGGAGIQADIETIRVLGGHAASLISCHTVQNSQGLQALYPADPRLLRQQAACLLDDMPIAAIKLGALGSVSMLSVAVDIIRRARRQQPELPVVIDPVLAASAGGSLSPADLPDALRERLLPLATLITPNHAELHTLSGNAAVAQAAQTLQALGCPWVLVTGTDSPSADTGRITHSLYGPAQMTQDFSCPRLPGQYHGSGCTLAAAVALYLAQGRRVPDAVRRALDFCQQSLRHAQSLGQGQLFPRRGDA